MARSDQVLQRVHRAYEVAHLAAAAYGLLLAAFVVVLALSFHRTANATWLVVSALSVALAVLGWRGGALRRGAFSGVIAGLPPLVVPALVFGLSGGAHCTSCDPQSMLPCTLACFGSSALVGGLVGYRASSDPMPRRYAIAAITTAALTGLLGCGTTGLSGAVGVVVGLGAGGVTGWAWAARTAHV